VETKPPLLAKIRLVVISFSLLNCEVNKVLHILSQLGWVTSMSKGFTRCLSGWVRAFIAGACWYSSHP
jgi:hypothetical protein